MVTTKSKLQMALDCRANVEQFNHQCFERSAKICEPLDIKVKKPRICGRQIMRDNVEAECPEDYFRKSITVSFLYCTRFTDLHATFTQSKRYGNNINFRGGSRDFVDGGAQLWSNIFNN
jgi:hypothetical protein